MSVISTLFEKIAAHIPDAAKAQEMLAEGAKADPTKGTSAKRAVEAATMEQGKDAAAWMLEGLIVDAYKIRNALTKMRAPVSMTIRGNDDGTSEDWENEILNTVTIELLQENKRLMLFKASYLETGGYFLETEHSSSGGMPFTLIKNHSTLDITGVENALGKDLATAFNVQPGDAEHVLSILIKAVDYRATRFEAMIQTKPFEEVLDFVKKGIDATHAYAEYAEPLRPINLVLSSRYPDQTGITPFTPEQRLELFEAIICQSKNIAAALPRMTMSQASIYNCTNIIPRLLELGLTITDGDFVRAGGHRSDQQAKIETLKMLRPHVSSVNVTEFGKSAGFSAAMGAHCDVFRWLESQGMDKEARFSNNLPTYAHGVACGSSRKENVAAGEKDNWPELMRHLVSEGYNIDVPGPAGTPLDIAVQKGHLDLAKILIDAGAKLDSSLMLKTITGAYCGLPAKDALEFMTYLHEEHKLPYTQQAADEVFKLISSTTQYDFFNAQWDTLQPMAAIAEFLATQGVKPSETPELAELRSTAAEKLRGADAAVLASLGIEALPVVKRAPRFRPS